VAVVSFAQADNVRRESTRNEVETLMPVFAELFANTGSGITKDDIDFICSGSTDYLIGGPFSFVAALDAIGVYPPRRESHVEMDAAWALYEAWVALQDEGVDTALVYGFGKSSLGQLHKILSLQLDPYVMAPLWPDPVSLAALQARTLLDAGTASEADFAAVAARSRRAALENPKAQVAYDRSVEQLLAEDYVVSPLRRHALPPITDGAAAVVLAAGTRAFEWAERPAWITGIDHRIETHALGARDLATSPSTARAGLEAGVGEGPVDVAELHAPFAHQELILAAALGLGDGVDLNPSGGALAANALMAGGLIRIGEAANRVMDGRAGRAVAHATSGPVLQHNLVTVLEGV
jgi:acetyl-CoA acetyltransferase